jgi:hypothetical protein
MDNDAIALDGAIQAAQRGDAGAVERIAKLRNRLSKRVTASLLQGNDISIGGNLLLSAATTARNAARAGDIARLADMRRQIAEARTKLAEEVIGK